MITPPAIQRLTNENTMLTSASIEDLEEYKKNACKILRSQTQCATAKIVEELINQEILAEHLHVFDCALKIIGTQNRQFVVAEVYERVENNISGENTKEENFGRED